MIESGPRQTTQENWLPDYISLNLTVFLIVCITLFVIFILFSLWLIHNMDKLQPAKTGYGIQRVTCSTQAAQDLISQRTVCERNGQIVSQGARRKQAMVAAKKRVAYSKLKPKIYVQEGSEMIELKELGNNSPAKSTSSGDLNFNVAQAVADVHGKDPLFKKVQLPKYKNGYQLVGNANERFETVIDIESIPEETEEEVDQFFPFKAEDIEKAGKSASE